MKNKLLLIIILIIYTVIPILILFSDYLYSIKFYILSVIGLLVFILFKLFKVPNKELGITNNNIMLSIKNNLSFIIVCIVFVVLLKLIHIDKYNPNETLLFYLFYIFISCPIQEFLYRGIFGYFDLNSKYHYIWIIISSLCYSFVHIIYRDILTCLLTFIIGIIWYLLYKKDNNLCGVILSHIILGVATILLGIVD